LLTGLEERGFIRRLPAKDRAIEVVKLVSRFAAYKFDVASKRLSRSGG
jgi:SOS-response transcriptional repressor LexA